MPRVVFLLFFFIHSCVCEARVCIELASVYDSKFRRTANVRNEIWIAESNGQQRAKEKKKQTELSIDGQYRHYT